ncbi:MAG: 1-deoxy-D-xylulose-5-phosphate synthase [Gemmatimonadetes bacterium]|nr:1-deoxy-D-xylulose-5-phosphate synthase [Gemmatimonadota bacterium]
MAVEIHLIPLAEFRRIREAPIERLTKLDLLADMCRANTLAAVKRAGSGHLGTSFSAMDIVVWLYHEEMNTVRVGLGDPDRDIYFSSKGHDAPGLYAVLFSLEVLPEEKLLKLRRLGGLDGHPDVGVPGVEANSGSLGMGISKAKGMAWAKRYHGNGGRVFVMTGDGELQEGQIYEALQTAAHQRLNLTVIVDHNKLQSDKPVDEIIALGDLEVKFRSFGWHVARCDGHDYRQLERTFRDLRSVADRPKILIADTIKGRGVSFMEGPAALAAGGGLYRWHAGAPDDASFRAGFAEIVGRLNDRLAHAGLAPLTLKDVTPRGDSVSGVSREYVAEAFGEALVEVAAERPDLVVLDGDLAADCRIRAFERAYPERFIENGIAEQDMVSMAGGLARQGLLPVVNTFASFLASRANEQIYNNASEGTRVIYACHYAGLIPAGPGKSHQSIRDISLFSALPNCLVLQPCNALETRMAIEHCVNEATENCVLRLVIGPSPRAIELPAGYRLTRGRGVTLVEGDEAVLFAYGPVMLHEALTAAEILAGQGLLLRVVNLPWLNRVDGDWLAEAVLDSPFVFVLEDHAPVGGLGDHLLPLLVRCGRTGAGRFHKFAVEGYPACGAPGEVLRYHRLDGESLAGRIAEVAGRPQA